MILRTSKGEFHFRIIPSIVLLMVIVGSIVLSVFGTIDKNRKIEDLPVDPLRWKQVDRYVKSSGVPECDTALVYVFLMHESSGVDCISSSEEDIQNYCIGGTEYDTVSLGSIMDWNLAPLGSLQFYPYTFKGVEEDHNVDLGNIMSLKASVHAFCLYVYLDSGYSEAANIDEQVYALTHHPHPYLGEDIGSQIEIRTRLQEAEELNRLLAK